MEHDVLDQETYKYYIPWLYAGLGGHGSSEIPYRTVEEAYAQIADDIKREGWTWQSDLLRTVESEFGMGLDGKCPGAYIQVLEVDNQTARCFESLCHQHTYMLKEFEGTLRDIARHQLAPTYEEENTGWGPVTITREPAENKLIRAARQILEKHGKQY